MLLFKEPMQKFYSNFEIFTIFKSNKRILLFLIEEGIVKLNESIVIILVSSQYETKNYPKYFLPELKPFKDENWFKQYTTKKSFFGFRKEFLDLFDNELPENFYENRKIGENDSYICKLIREDSIEDFIIFVNKNNYSLNSTIESSIYETNQKLSSLYSQSVIFGKFSFSQKKSIQLIEYAAFFGSIQIFQYLRKNGVELTPSIWNYAIHGKDAEIINILVDNNILPQNNSYKSSIIESIKCHHNNIVNYILNNFSDEDLNSPDILKQSFHFYNFMFIENELINESLFFQLCGFDYFYFVYNLLTSKDININKITKILFVNIINIISHFFLMKFLIDYFNIILNFDISMEFKINKI